MPRLYRKKNIFYNPVVTHFCRKNHLPTPYFVATRWNSFVGSAKFSSARHVRKIVRTATSFSFSPDVTLFFISSFARKELKLQVCQSSTFLHACYHTPFSLEKKNSKNFKYAGGLAGTFSANPVNAGTLRVSLPRGASMPVRPQMHPYTQCSGSGEYRKQLITGGARA